MKLTWVNHASFMLELGNYHLICDPWIEGSAFNNGWNLLAPRRPRCILYRSDRHTRWQSAFSQFLPDR